MYQLLIPAVGVKKRKGKGVGENCRGTE